MRTIARGRPPAHRQLVRGPGRLGLGQSHRGSVTRADTKPPRSGWSWWSAWWSRWWWLRLPWHTATPSRRQRSTMLFCRAAAAPAVTHARSGRGIRVDISRAGRSLRRARDVKCREQRQQERKPESCRRCSISRTLLQLLEPGSGRVGRGRPRATIDPPRARCARGAHGKDGGRGPVSGRTPPGTRVQSVRQRRPSTLEMVGVPVGLAGGQEDLPAQAPAGHASETEVAK